MSQDTNHHEFHQELFAQFARIGKAISSPARVEIIYLLSQGEKSVEHLARAAGLSVANASQHLQQLKGARMVVGRKQGQQVNYRLASPLVERLWLCLQAIGEDRLLEVQELLQPHRQRLAAQEAMTREELLERLERNAVVVLDVRPKDEYQWGHLPRAVSMPLGELAGRMRELPQDREIIAYCRGPYSPLSYQAVASLTAKGYHARRLKDGFPEWKAHQLPVEGAPAPRG